MSDTSTLLVHPLGPAVRLHAHDGAQSTVLLHGAHVLSWKPAGAGEQLYLSPRALAGEGQAVRGGVPVIFPQFDRRGPDVQVPRHGFARTRSWRVEPDTHGRATAAGQAQATFILEDDASTRALWPHAFQLKLTVSVGAQQLTLSLEAHNPGPSSWAFTAALHTYLTVSDVTQAFLEGLAGRRYWDSVTAREVEARGSNLQERSDVTRISGEVDRIYGDVSKLLLHDGARKLAVESEGLPDAVLWNPGAEKCALLQDMPSDGFRSMLCIEAARIFQPLSLAAGERWTGQQTLSLAGAGRTTLR